MLNKKINHLDVKYGTFHIEHIDPEIQIFFSVEEDKSKSWSDKYWDLMIKSELFFIFNIVMCNIFVYFVIVLIASMLDYIGIFK